MPSQEFRPDPDSDSDDTDGPVRVTWDFAYEEIYVAVGNRTFQLHSAEELRTTGVRIGTTVRDEVFVALVATREGERFLVSRNEVPMVGEPIHFGASSATATITPLKVTANVATPGKGTWLLQEKVEGARRWCRSLAAASGAVVLYFALKTGEIWKNPRRDVMLAFGIAALGLIAVDLLAKWDRTARVTLLATPLLFGLCIVAVVQTYRTMLSNGVELLSPQTFGVLGVILGLLYATIRCLMAQGAASTLHKAAKAHRELHQPII